MKYVKGYTFHKYHKDYVITEVTDTTIEFLCLEKNPSGYQLYQKMDIKSFEEATEGTGVWEHLAAEVTYLKNNIKIEDLLA